jgi:hypothetical protein
MQRSPIRPLCACVVVSVQQFRDADSPSGTRRVALIRFHCALRRLGSPRIHRHTLSHGCCCTAVDLRSHPDYELPRHRSLRLFASFRAEFDGRRRCVLLGYQPIRRTRHSNIRDVRPTEHWWDVTLFHSTGSGSERTQILRDNHWVGVHLWPHERRISILLGKCAVRRAGQWSDRWKQPGAGTCEGYAVTQLR